MERTQKPMFVSSTGDKTSSKLITSEVKTFPV